MGLWLNGTVSSSPAGGALKSLSGIALMGGGRFSPPPISPAIREPKVDTSGAPFPTGIGGSIGFLVARLIAEPTNPVTPLASIVVVLRPSSQLFLVLKLSPRSDFISVSRVPNIPFFLEYELPSKFISVFVLPKMPLLTSYLSPSRSLTTFFLFPKIPFLIVISSPKPVLMLTLDESMIPACAAGARLRPKTTNKDMLISDFILEAPFAVRSHIPQDSSVQDMFPECYDLEIPGPVAHLRLLKLATVLTYI